MASPLDPLKLFDRWVDATTWWVEPAARTSAALLERMTPERMLADVIDGVLARFAGQRIELVLSGHRVVGELESLRVVGSGDALGVIADLSDVAWEGPPLTHLQARVRGVRVTPGVPGEVRIDGVDLQGRTTLTDLASWAEGRTGAWTVTADERGRLHAELEERSLHLTAEPTYADGRLDFELRAARWRGAEVRIPRWLRLTRSQALPALPPGAELVDAHRTGDEVLFRARVGGFTAPLDLNRLRDTIVRGGAVTVG